MEERFFHMFNSTMYNEYNNEKTGTYFFPSHQAFFMVVINELVL
jgi:hypothetical protein